MSEYNHDRYYWIKLKQSLMTSKAVDFLMSQKDGANYVVLYQCLCLKTVNQNGELADRIGEIIVPFDENKIQRETKWFSIDTIRVAMSLYKQLGLIYEQENGILKIADFEDLVGSQTISAYKKQIQLQNKGGNQGGIKVENFPPDNKSIDNKILDNKSIDIDINKKNKINNKEEYIKEVNFENAEKEWEAIKSNIEYTISGCAFDLYFNSISKAKKINGILHICAQTPMLGQTIKEHFNEQMQNALDSSNVNISRIILYSDSNGDNAIALWDKNEEINK